MSRSPTIPPEEALDGKTLFFAKNSRMCLHMWDFFCNFAAKLK
jgi:hypothetical protein